MKKIKQLMPILIAVLALSTIFALPSKALYLTRTNGSGQKFYLNLYGNSMYSGRKLSAYYTTSPGNDQNFIMISGGFLCPRYAQTYAVNRSSETNSYFKPNAANYAIIWPLSTGRKDSQFVIGSLTTGNNMFMLLNYHENNVLSSALLSRPSTMSQEDYVNGAYYVYFMTNSGHTWRGEH